MSANLLKKRLFAELDSFFKERGFQRKSDRFYGERYDLAIEGGRKSLIISTHLRKPALVLDPATASIRLDKVEEEVFKFEERNELLSEYDALQRNTIGLRLSGSEIVNIATNRYAMATEGDCVTVAQKYATEMLRKAEVFWAKFPNQESILEKLSDVPGKARDYAGSDLFAAVRAVTLAKLLKGEIAARGLASEIMEHLSGTTKSELSGWVKNAFRAWETSGMAGV